MARLAAALLWGFLGCGDSNGGSGDPMCDSACLKLKECQIIQDVDSCLTGCVQSASPEIACVADAPDCPAVTACVSCDCDVDFDCTPGCDCDPECP